MGRTRKIYISFSSESRGISCVDTAIGVANVSLELFPEAVSEAEQFLKSEIDTLERFEKVARLIEGYETPYGMELLATVHWVAAHEDGEAKTDPERAIAGVLSWNEHKKDVHT